MKSRVIIGVALVIVGLFGISVMLPFSIPGNYRSYPPTIYTITTTPSAAIQPGSAMTMDYAGLWLGTILIL